VLIEDGERERVSERERERMKGGRERQRYLKMGEKTQRVRIGEMKDIEQKHRMRKKMKE
jgi:hypothetical protein